MITRWARSEIGTFSELLWPLLAKHTVQLFYFYDRIRGGSLWKRSRNSRQYKWSARIALTIQEEHSSYEFLLGAIQR